MVCGITRYTLIKSEEKFIGLFGQEKIRKWKLLDWDYAGR